MTTKNVTSTVFDGSSLYGVTSIDIEADNSSEAVHTDGDAYASSITDGIKTRAVTVNGVDLEDLRGVVSASAGTLVITLEGIDGDSNVTVTLSNAKPHSYSLESGDPGGNGSASITFNGKSADGTTDPLAIA